MHKVNAELALNHAGFSSGSKEFLGYMHAYLLP
jgi:hypothetical protein